LFLVTTSAHVLRRAINEPHRAAWGAFSALMFFFLVNSISSSAALRHSDIAWAVVLLASFYARAAMRSDVRPQPAGLQHGSNPVWPTAPTVGAVSHVRRRSPTA